MTKSKWVVVAVSIFLIVCSIVADTIRPRSLDSYLGVMFLAITVAWVWVLITAKIKWGWKLAGVVPVSFGWMATCIGFNTNNRTVFEIWWLPIIPAVYLAAAFVPPYLAQREEETIRAAATEGSLAKDGLSPIAGGLLAFGLFLATGFSFDLGVTWLQMVLWVAGIVLTVKTLSDQGRFSIGWFIGAVFFSSIAALAAV